MASSDYNIFGILAGNQVIVNSGTNRVIGDFGSSLTENVAIGATLTVLGDKFYSPDIDDALMTSQNIYDVYLTVTADQTFAGSDIGGQTFVPGFIELSYSGTITLGNVANNNTVTLNGDGAYYFLLPNAGLRTETTNDNVFFNLINGAKASKVLWIINGDVNLQSNGSNITSFAGAVLSSGNIELDNLSTSAGSLVAFSSSGVVTLNGNIITSITNQIDKDNVETNYINIETTLADSRAIAIKASSTFGGIAIEAGFGGIDINTTNAISLDAQAASNFTTTNGNLTLQATAGLINIDGGSGINIGNESTTGPVEISTINDRQVDIGNNGGVSQINVRTGTGGFNVNTNNGAISLNSNNTISNFTNFTNADNQDLNIALVGATNSKIKLDSQGIGADAIQFISAGGVIYNAAQPIQLISSAASGTAVNIDTFPNGGVNISSGAFGIGINSNGAVLGIGHFSGGPVYFATAATARDIYFGSNGGPVNIYQRYGNALTTTQYLETALVDPGVGTNTDLTPAQIFGRIIYGTPSIDVTLTVPATSAFTTALGALQTNDSLDFSVINQSTTNSYTLVATSIIGNAVVLPGISATFRIKFTGTPATAPSGYILYRIN